MNLNVTITPEEILTDSLQKIGALSEICFPDRITGFITNTAVDLFIKKNGKSINLVGKWDEESQTMASYFWDGDIPSITFNFHPLNSMGGLDLPAFENAYKRLYNGQD